MTKSIVLSLIFFYLLSSHESFSQKKKKLKFGKITDKEIAMTHYDKDSTAIAVVLYDYGKFSSVNYYFTRHARIKILKTEGTSWGNWTLNTPSKGNFRAKVFNSENGEVVVSKLNKSSVIEDEVTDGLVVYKLFLPNVKKGSVIDLEYSYLGLPYAWKFQHFIPTVYSELHIESSPYFQFTKRQFGFEHLNKISTNHYIAEDIPSFASEPYMSDPSNYITKLEIEVSASLYRTYSTTWKRVNEQFMTHSRFGRVQSNSAFLNAKAKEIKQSEMTDEEKG